ncbi:MAG TPA: IS200/IS605 family transposase [Chthonomonas sp.]|uniref:IS200/IS605 family transposase n=1 Tax=Chthonomonas sp. TaxID=2282153 RepID=UPI002B4B101F|nr:IS200/IS605 family transposase [Chthonomonas sp.]HLI47974.1 IS200/IS605 family transposase [Chthonomonas sp.]
MNQDYRKSGNRVHNLNLRIVFCPKYCRKCLTGEVATRCDELLREKCAELDCEGSALEIMPDHVHLFVAVTPDLAPNHIVAQVKGYISRVLRREFPHLLKMLSLWTRSYYVGAVGHVSQTVVQAAIENQKGK